MNPSKLSYALGLILCLTSACERAQAKGPSINTDASDRVSATDPAKLPYYRDESFTPHWIESADQLKADFHRIPTFSLTNQLGQNITNETFAGKIYVANFFFTSCAGICGKMNSNMRRVQEAFDDDGNVMFLSHSVTPEADTPAVLRRYAKRFDCKPGKWHLATGKQEQIFALGREGYFVEEDQGRPRDKEAFLHSESLVLVDAHRHIRGIYNGLNRTDVDRLIRDVGTLRDTDGLAR